MVRYLCELNRFVVYLALPALLFQIMATTPWHTLDQPAFIAVFAIGAGVVFLLTLLVPRSSRAALATQRKARPKPGFAFIDTTRVARLLRANP